MSPGDTLYDVLFLPSHILRGKKPGEIFDKLPSRAKEVLSDLTSKDTEFRMDLISHFIEEGNYLWKRRKL